MRLIPLCFLGAVAALFLCVWAANAGDGGACCHQCGCTNLQKVCRLVPTVTKVPKVEYSCKCGEICVPGRSQCVGTETVTDCNGNCYQVPAYQPTCGRVYATVTPAKTTTFTEKCGYKCVVGTVCGNCGCSCGSPGVGYAAHSYAPTGFVPHPHEEPHPLHRQSN
jgi:hypothetical protein